MNNTTYTCVLKTPVPYTVPRALARSLVPAATCTGTPTHTELLVYFEDIF